MDEIGAYVCSNLDIELPTDRIYDGKIYFQQSQEN